MSESHHYASLALGGLADHYLKNTDGVNEYRFFYPVCPGVREERRAMILIQYDSRSPSFARMEAISSDSDNGRFYAIATGTSTSRYDSRTHTWDLLSRINLSHEYDYLRSVRQFIIDGDFSVLEWNTDNGAPRCPGEVVTDPWVRLVYTEHKIPPHGVDRALFRPGVGSCYLLR